MNPHEKFDIKMVVVGAHNAIEAEKPIPGWMKGVKTHFPITINEKYSPALEKYIIGQIFTRFVLGLHPCDKLQELSGKSGEIIDRHESKLLAGATKLKCRYNLLRLLTLMLLKKSPSQRPSHAFCLKWPSTWSDSLFLPFLTRFYDRINATDIKREAGILCELFQPQVMPKGWVKKEILGNECYEMLLETVFNSDLRYTQNKQQPQYNISYSDMSAAQVSEVVSKLEKKGLFGLFSQIRNRTAHAFENKLTLETTGKLSTSYTMFWRKKFPLVVTAAVLISINLNLHRDASFEDFFDRFDDTYSDFKNMNCHGERLDCAQAME